MISRDYIAIEDLVETIIDNRGKSVPTVDGFGIPLIATNCIKFSSIYPAFENIRYISQETYDTWFRAHLEPNDILFVNKGTPGRCCITPDPVNFVGAQDMVGLRFKKEYHPFYMLAVIRSNEIQETIQNNHVGLVIAHFRKQELVKLKLPILNKNIRDYIGEIYKNISFKIELNNKTNVELEAMAKTLYDYWFVQFDFPNEEGKPYKSSKGKMVWNEELKREIPEGWKVGTISDISELIRGVSYDKKSIKTSNDSNVIPILRATNISGNQIDLNDMVYVPSELVNEKQILNKFDILITMSSGSIDHIGKNGFYYYDETVSFGAFCAKFVPKQHYHFYLFSYTQSDFMSNTIKNECLGTNINNLNSGMVNGFKLVIPDNNCLKLFNDKVESLYQKISINYKENQELASLRDWLLPMLMNGQVSVGDVEEQLGMVAEPVKILNKVKKKETKVISIKPSNVEIYKRTLLAAEIVYQLKDTNTLGHLKLQKMLYLCQEIGSMNLPMNFLKQAMGPYDNQLARSLDKQFVLKKWFEYQNGALLKYKPLENCGKHKEDFLKFFENEIEQINYLINKFTKFTSNQIEAVATLYACWKEAIEQKELISDKLIVTKFYQWSKEKEKFKEENLIKALAWMRNNSICPK